MKRVFYAVVTALLTLLAFANVAGACHFTNYQPEVPSKLR
jgi:cyclic lactone autoinducer peptide